MQGLFKKIYSTNIYGLLKLLSWILIFFCSAPSAFASHLVGGNLTYRALGNDLYEITLVIRRDCINGSDTVPFDNPAILGVFYGDNQKAFRLGVDGTFRLKQMADDTLRESIDNICSGPFKPVCVHQTFYRDTIKLPFDERGYFLVYQRCCRNTTLKNVENPTLTGNTYVVKISNFQNSSAQLGPFPPIYACLFAPFEFDHSATDPDPNDSLVYSFCTPFKGKTFDDPAGRPDFPPYEFIEWKSPYDTTNLIGSLFTINPQTGFISGTPTVQGQFLVGVCIKEYRNGQLISQVFRDFELNFEACGVSPVAQFKTKTDPCNGLTVAFENLSQNGTEYTWFFDWQNDRSLQSTMINPVFTYSKEGQYEVVLVTKNISCFDTARLLITVLDPMLMPDFIDSLDCGKDADLRLFDRSTSRYPIVMYDWKISGRFDTFNLTGKNPIVRLKNEGIYEVTLTIIDSFGCKKSITKEINYNIIDLDLVANDTTICFGDSVRLVKNPDPRLSYIWTPTEGLNLSRPFDPIAKPDTTTTYKVIVSDGMCSIERSITVFIKNKVNIRITGDTATCDGIIELNADSDSTSVFIWSYSPDFNPIIFSGKIFSTTITGNKRIYVKAGETSECPDTHSILLLDQSIEIDFNKEYTICTNDSLDIQIISKQAEDSLSIIWKDHKIIVGSTMDLKTKILSVDPGRYVLCFTVKNKFGCEKTDSIVVNVIDIPVPKIELDNECGSLKVSVSTDALGKVQWDFGDGIGSSMDRSTMYTYQKPGAYTIRLRADSVCLREVSMEVIVVELKINLKDTALSCFGNMVELNPGGDPKFRYQWSPEEGLDDPMSPNPKVTVSSSRWYYVTVTDQDFPEKCKLIDSIFVFVPPFIEAYAGQDSFLCEKTKINLKAAADSNVVNYIWCDQHQNQIATGQCPELNIDSSTTFILKVMDRYGCLDKDTVRYILYDLKVKITGPESICIGDTALLIAQTEPPGKYTYVWNPAGSIIGSNQDSFILVNPGQSTIYTLTVSNDVGCVWEATHTVNVHDINTLLNVEANPQIVVAGQTSQLTATFNPNWRYQWAPQDGSLSDPNIHNPIAKPTKTTSYTVTVTDEIGCTATASITITVQNCLEAVFIPNAFSPNNDSKNDELCVYSRPGTITKMELVIFNRWGEKVFGTSDPNACWDGFYKNQKLSPDVFGYLLMVQCPDGEEVTKKGNISLLK